MEYKATELKIDEHPTIPDRPRGLHQRLSEALEFPRDLRGYGSIPALSGKVLPFNRSVAAIKRAI
jgi:hypothetical protein